MAKYEINRPAISQARDLIDQGKVNTETEWSDGPSTDREKEVIDRDGYNAYSAWHLAIDTEASEGTKDRFGFPYGDFSRVNRAAVIHAKQRASQNDHDAVVEAADDLLERMDRASG